MFTLLSNLAKQSTFGSAMVALVVTAFFIGLVSFAVGYIVLAWWMLMTHIFGAPALDFWGGLGLLMFAVPAIILVVLTSQAGGK
jgi:hypothetical protein